MKKWRVSLPNVPPLPVSLDGRTRRLEKYDGILVPEIYTTLVLQDDLKHQLWTSGFFGKGALSRSGPAFEGKSREEAGSKAAGPDLGRVNRVDAAVLPNAI